MKVDVLLGLQWGDEGKGKVVDVLTPNYDVITRFQEVPMLDILWNLTVKSMCYVPSLPVFSKGKVNVIGNGVVLIRCCSNRKRKRLLPAGTT